MMSYFTLLKTSGWDGYELIDSGEQKRLERYGKYRLIRPDPDAIWRRTDVNEWANADAVFVDDKGNPHWEHGAQMPENWLIKYKTLTLQARLTPFKHTGIFPEQQVNWDFLSSVIANGAKPRTVRYMAKRSLKIALSVASGDTPRNDNLPNVLNLFGYTGAASLVCAAVGAKVTHVDASKPAISWARENQKLSGLLDKPIRWIMDDAIKFVTREVRRGVKYDGIIMDPPVYGHGPGGEVWDFHKSFPELISLCPQVLSPQPLFFIVNAYAISSSALMLKNVLSDYLLDFGGTCEFGEITLEEKIGKRLLSTGIFVRWSFS
ncbi:MAG: class I SAM-dependent methyltransferase [Candidatus Levybacteria bacterium]|nr:class I SAM-dependent methyltransferase [Candidatus Levybacteria bacterium]